MKYVFMHIEKTAGTSLVSYFKNIFQDKFLYIHPTKLKDLSQKNQLEKYDMIAGHFTYKEVLHYLPNREKIIFLRNPKDRVVSFYNFVKNNPETNDYVTKISKELAFTNFIEYCIKMNDRRFINGITYKLSTELNIRNELNSALLNIEQVDFIGFQETFDKDLKKMILKYGFKDIQHIPMENVTNNKFKVDLSSEDKAKIEKITKDDFLVYLKAIEVSN